MKYYFLKGIELVLNYLINVLYALDQLGNALLRGRADHTISGRCGYNYYVLNKKHFYLFVVIIDSIFFWDDKHCFEAIEWDEVKKPIRKWVKLV